MKRRERKAFGLKGLVCVLAASLVLAAAGPGAVCAADDTVVTEEMNENDSADGSTDGAANGANDKNGTAGDADDEAGNTADGAAEGRVLGVGRQAPKTDDLGAAACFLAVLSVLAVIAFGWAQKKDGYKEGKNV
jgi:hypothetical protein